MAELDHTSPEYAAVADRYQRVEHEFQRPRRILH